MEKNILGIKIYIGRREIEEYNQSIYIKFISNHSAGGSTMSQIFPIIYYPLSQAYTGQKSRNILN